MPDNLILASGSSIRQQLLRGAGVPFDVVVARVDEDSIRQSLIATDAKPRDIADQLAQAKARKVAQKHPDRLVLGCDQILSLHNKILTKPESADNVRQQLQELRAQKHQLFSAAVIYDQGQPVWRHVGQVNMTMRDASDSYLDAYVDRNWHSIQHSVGGYKLEEEGARLFHKIDGDYFHVLGISLLEILAFLTLRGVIDG